MEIRIHDLLDGLEDCSIPMEEPDVVSAMRIKELTKMKIEQQESLPRRFVRKRFFPLALAAVLLLCLGAVAFAVAGIPRFTATYRMENTGVYTSLEDLPEAEKTVGYPICLPERFSCSYAFSGMTVDGEAVYDDDYSVLQEYYTVHATYTRPDSPDLLLSLSPVLDLPETAEAPPPSSSFSIGDRELKIYRDHYKIVPEDYEKTEEDLAAEAAGHYYVSFGSDSIEEMDIASADFVLDGVNYCFFQQDASACPDELLVQMAAELLEAAAA